MLNLVDMLRFLRVPTGDIPPSNFNSESIPKYCGDLYMFSLWCFNNKTHNIICIYAEFSWDNKNNNLSCHVLMQHLASSLLRLVLALVNRLTIEFMECISHTKESGASSVLLIDVAKSKSHFVCFNY